jgi:4,5-DOPA dioxygenase extradiol
VRAALSRRALVGGSVGLALSHRLARGAEPPSLMPVGFVGHGSPLLAVDPVRGPGLAVWGGRIPVPRGILVMTPHYGTRRIELGATGRGVAMRNMPKWISDQLPSDLSYPTPPSDALAARVEALLAGSYAVNRSSRPGFDHTTWIPLRHLFPDANVPVLEIAFPYRPDRELFALGRKLAPLRREGIFFLASGGITHNLAAVDLEPHHPIPPWSWDFDDWARRAVEAHDVDALLDWRAKAPAANLAHPDDGGHFRVLLVALGVVLDETADPRVMSPIAGFEGGLSVRCIELGGAPPPGVPVRASPPG